MKLLKKTHCLRDRLSLDMEVERDNKGDPPQPGRLIALASQVYRNHSGMKYNKVFICWYLPGMVLDSGAWATTHFIPHLSVKILGVENGVMENQEA